MMYQISFATMNISGGIPYEKNALFHDPSYDAIDYLSEIINKNQLDIVCFQEILMADEEHNSMTDTLAQRTGLIYSSELLLSDSHLVKGRKMGVSVISKYPILETYTFMLTNPHISFKKSEDVIYRSHEKGYLFLKLDLPSGEAWCVTGHSLPYHSFKVDDWDYQYIYKEIGGKLMELAADERPILIGSDFNSDILLELLPELTGPYLSLINVVTRPNGHHHDYILCSKDVMPLDAHLMNSCFDHYGCMARFGIMGNEQKQFIQNLSLQTEMIQKVLESQRISFDKNILFTQFPSLQNIDDKFSLASHSFIDDLGKMGIDQENSFSTWGVDIRDFPEKNSIPLYISVCCTCFGILMSKHYSERKNIDFISQEGAINLLLFLRDSSTYGWLSCLEDGNRISGTMYQTMLAISTMLECGFLTREDDVNVKTLARRYEFIRESMGWLDKNLIIKNQDQEQIAGWGYMPGNQIIRQGISSFGFETLGRYQSSLLQIASIMVKENGILNSILDDLRHTMETMFMVLKYDSNGIDEERKYCSYSVLGQILLKYQSQIEGIRQMLSNIIMYEPDDTLLILQENIEKLVENLKEKCLSYLMSIPADAIPQFSAEAFFEDFVYEANSQIGSAGYSEGKNSCFMNKGENFEYSTEMVSADALILYSSQCRRRGDFDMAAKAYQKADKMIKQLYNERVLIQNGYLCIKGHRSVYPQYPIYSLYYYSVLLTDYLNFWK